MSSIVKPANPLDPAKFGGKQIEGCIETQANEAKVASHKAGAMPGKDGDENRFRCQRGPSVIER